MRSDGRARCGAHSHQREKIHHGPAFHYRHRSYGRKRAPRAGSAAPFECIALLLQGGQGDRIVMLFAAVHESLVGTKRTFRLPRWMSAFTR
jgi:hypothetical protein